MSRTTRENLLPGSYAATGYHSVQTLRESGRPMPAEGTGDRHLRDHREILGAEGDRLDRDSFVYEGVLNRATEAILGRDGFSVRFMTPDVELNARMKADWDRWALSPEVTGRHSWQDCQELALRACWNRGDVGIIRTNLERVQYVESPRITGGRRAVEASREKNGGRLEQGVELDRFDRTLAYWVAPYTAYGDVDRNRAKRVSADVMELFAHWKKFSQCRGVPVLQTAMPLIHRLNDILDSEAVGWQQLARFTAFFGMEGAGKTAHGKSTDEDPKGAADLTDRVADLEQGTLVFGKPGETLAGIERNIPGKQFPESVRMFLRLIGMPFGLPLSFLLLDYSDTTYTASRAEVEQAFRVFIRWQRHLKRKHHDPITRWWIKWGIEAGRYPEKSPEEFDAFYKFRHDAPEFPWIDMLKEAQAWGLRLDRSLATQNEALLSTGSTFDEHLEARAAEMVKARTKAAEISGIDVKALPPVDWRLLAGYPVSLTEAQVEDGDEQTDRKTDKSESRKAGR